MNPNRLHQSFLGSYHLCRGSRLSERPAWKQKEKNETERRRRKIVFVKQRM